MLRAFGHHVATCCDVLRHVESSWLKFETGQIVDTAFVDVVVVWPGSCNNFAPGHAY